MCINNQERVREQFESVGTDHSEYIVKGRIVQFYRLYPYL